MYITIKSIKYTKIFNGGYVPLAQVLFLAVFIAIFGGVLLVLTKITGIRPKKTSSIKLELYECGLPGIEKKDTKVSVKYYLTAILFILFDIEIIFMYPWASEFQNFIQSGLGPQVFIAMLIFLGIFIFGLLWEVKSKALDWE